MRSSKRSSVRVPCGFCSVCLRGNDRKCKGILAAEKNRVQDSFLVDTQDDAHLYFSDSRFSFGD